MMTALWFLIAGVVCFICLWQIDNVQTEVDGWIWFAGACVFSSPIIWHALRLMDTDLPQLYFLNIPID